VKVAKKRAIVNDMHKKRGSAVNWTSRSKTQNK